MQITEDQITAAARALSNDNADICNVNREDNWMLYGDSFRETAKIALEAAFARAVPVPQEGDERARVRDTIAEALGDAYDCTRVWSAWSYGTMGPNDFALVSDDDARLDEIADAVMAALASNKAAAVAARPADDALWDQTLTERDNYHEWADKLANAIAEHFGIEIGEHSNLNNPWSVALDTLESMPVAAAVAVPGEEYQVKSDPIMRWETYQDRAVAQKHFDQLKADGCNTQFRVIYTAPIASAEEAVPTAADILANQMQFGADMAAKYSRVCRELAALKAVAPDEDFVKRALATYNSEYCLQRAAGVGGGEAELIAMTKVLSTHPSAAQPSRAEVLETWRPIETAPKTGGTLLLGYPNVLGKWCTVRGQWMSEAYIAENWEEPDDAEAGWYETSAEADDVPNCWLITPTHWIPLPPAPETKP